MESVGLELKCKACGEHFYICDGCYRGHAYCSLFCRTDGKKKNRKKAQQRYEKTFKGKKARARRQATYRKKKDSQTWPNTSSAIEIPLFSQLIDRSFFSETEEVTHAPPNISYISIKDSVVTSIYCSASSLSEGKKCCICRIRIEKLEKRSERERMAESRLGKFRSGRSPSG